MASTPNEVTQLLHAWRNGDQTALVHEAYWLLAGQAQIDWQNRAHFFGVAAQAMRRVLVEYARTRNYQKRGGKAQHVALEAAAELAEERAAEVVALDEVAERDAELVALDDALQSLAALDPQQRRIIKLRYFGGLTIEETAEALGLSATTVEREWRLACAWLLRELSFQFSVFLRSTINIPRRWRSRRGGPQNPAGLGKLKTGL